MLIGVFQSLTILATGIIYYIMDLRLMRRYDPLRKRSSRNWGYTAIILVFGLFASLQPILWPQLGLSTAAWWGLLLQIIGLVLVTGGLILHWKARIHLGEFFYEGVELQPGHRVVTTGPYSYVRHPIYISYFLWTTGMVLINPALTTLAANLYAYLLFVPMSLKEENMLSEHVSGYAEYIVRTHRFLPKLDRYPGGEMDWETFKDLPTAKVIPIVHEKGPKVCVFPVNGTRRWLALEHPQEMAAGFATAYLDIVGQKFIELFSLFFDHGVQTLLSPFFGPDLLERGQQMGDYGELVSRGLAWFAQEQIFMDFYDAYDVRVRVYGDTQRYLKGSPHEHVLAAYEELARRTAHHQRHRLFIGVFAHDAAETVAEIGASLYRELGRLPNKREIVEAYYGEYIEPADLFIGFDRPTVFDMPLIASGNESLYFTVAPSPYLDAQTLRAILYDHIYIRQVDDTAIDELTPEDWQALAEFYTLNRRSVLGIGDSFAKGHFWRPTPQVKLP